MRYRSSKKRTEKLDFWQSYSDMMAALLLVFALVLSGTLLEARQVFDQDHESLAQQQEQLEEQQRIIEEQQHQLEIIVGVRSNLINALKEEFEDSEFSVKIDSQTGAIIFDSNLLFDSGKYSIKAEGKEFLNSFLPKYISVILDDSFSPYVGEIIIEGHTDDIGSYMSNLELSQDRALAVATYCLNNGHGVLDEEQLEALRKLLTSNGRSESALIYEDDGVTVNQAASRRVEIKFRLKDDEMIDQMIQLLEG